MEKYGVSMPFVARSEKPGNGAYNLMDENANTFTDKDGDSEDSKDHRDMGNEKSKGKCCNFTILE